MKVSIYRRSETAPFYANIRREDGTRIRQSTGETDEAKAVQFALALQAKLDAEDVRDADGRRSITLAAALARYTSSLVSAKKTSAPFFVNLANKTIGVGVWDAKAPPVNANGKPRRKRAKALPGRFKLQGEMWLHDLQPTDLEDLKTARAAEGNGPQTIKHELSMIRAACIYAKGLRFRAPDIDDWRMPSTPEKTRYLSVEEFKALYAALDPDRTVPTRGGDGRVYSEKGMGGIIRRSMQDSQDLLVALAMTGGRWSEVAALTWDRVDMAAGTLRLFATKADAGERTVAIPTMLAAVLKRRAAERADLEEPLVFPSRRGGQRPQSSAAIRRAMDTVGLNRKDIVARYGRATVHSLRHTFASLLLQGGADLSEVQEAVGHTSLAMTRRYAHLSKGKTLTKLGGILSEISATR